MKQQSFSNRNPYRRKPLITALESRILLDGAAAVTAADSATDVDYQDDSAAAEGSSDSLQAVAPASSDNSSRREVAIVDTQLEDYQGLIDGLDAEVEVYLIDGDSNGLEQILALLEGEEGIDALHLYSHGSSGEIQLGSLTLSADTLDDNSELLGQLGELLDEEGDLLLYGCYVGSDADGQSFLDSLSSLTGADVAGSDDLTGAAALDGDWALEASAGSIETAAIASTGYDYSLVSSGFSDLYYTEGDGTVVVGGSVAISNNTYTYIEFAITDATSYESLGFVTDDTPSTTDGDLSIVGSTVYRGNGSSAVVIGSIDAEYDGQNGSVLRINFSAEFVNGDFSDGEVGSTEITGWSLVLDGVNLDGSDTIAGWATPTDSTYPSNNGSTGDSVSYSGDLDRSGTLSNYDTSSSDDLAIRLDTGSISLGQSYGVLRGPYVYSDTTVELEAGDEVSFDWKALSGGDAYDAYGYLLNVATGETITILDATGSSSNAETEWATETITITGSQEGEYRFVFVAGSYDFTGGNYVGGELMIDNVSVTDNTPELVGTATLSWIAQRLTYTNSAVDSASTTRTLSVTTDDGNTDVSTSTIYLTEENNAPTADGSATLASVDEDSTDPTGSSVSDLFGSVYEDVDAAYDPKDTLTGIVITGDSSDAASEGEWQYSTDAGSTWSAVGTVSASSGLVLDTDALLRFVPVADYYGSPGSLSVHLVDSSANSGGDATEIAYSTGDTRATYDTTDTGASGGAAAVSSDTALLVTTIRAVNDAPVMAAPTGSTYNDTIALDSSFSTTSGTLSATDVDNLTLTWGIDGGSDDGTQVTLVGSYGTLVLNKSSGEYVYTPDTAAINAANSTQSDSFTLTVSDGAASDSQTLSFTIVGVNDTPILALPTGTTYTDTSATDSFSAFSGTLSASDAEADTLSYQIDGGTDDGTLVTLVGSYGTLVLNKSSGAYTYTPDADAINAANTTVVDQFTLIASDGSASDSQLLNFSIDGVNDTPILAELSAASFSDTIDTDTFAAVSGTATATDADNPGEDLSYGILGGSDDGRQVTLVGSYGTLVLNKVSGAYTYTPDATAINGQKTAVTDTFILTVSDGDEQGDETLVVAIGGVNDAPIVETPEILTFEDTAGKDDFTAVSGTFVATDADLGEVLEYSIDGGTDDGDYVTLVGSYGTLVLDKSSGEYTYTPDDDAMNDADRTEVESFILNVTDGTDSESAELRFIIDGVVDNPATESGNTGDSGDTGIPAADPLPEADPVEVAAGELPDGLVEESGSTDSTGYLGTSQDDGAATGDSGLGASADGSDTTLGEGVDGGETASTAGQQGSTAQSGDSDNSADAGAAGEDSAGEYGTEEIIISEEGAEAVVTTGSDGQTTQVRASIDVNVSTDGEVLFSDSQQEAFEVVALAVASIGKSSGDTIVVGIEDTSPSASSQVYSGSLGDGSSLPEWIQVDPTTGSITIRQVPADTREVVIRVQAVGADGQVRVLELKLDLDELQRLEVDNASEQAETAAAFEPLAQQLEVAMQASDHYGDRLITLLESA